ncbi:hypothetical protein TNCV_2161231 [Trichonephila clavipes]|nr:hypothetical protein TNCV_2161231 [Trichonephila clavipes]
MVVGSFYLRQLVVSFDTTEIQEGDALALFDGRLYLLCDPLLPTPSNYHTSPPEVAANNLSDQPASLRPTVQSSQSTTIVHSATGYVSKTIPSIQGDGFV